MGKDIIDLQNDESDGEEEDNFSKSDDEDNESYADDLSHAEDDSNYEDEKRTAKISPREGRRRARKPNDPPLEVLMNNKDVPVAPGKREGDPADNADGLLEASTLSSNASADCVVKDRVIKLLNTGFHATSNEYEAKNAMKLAQRLRRKHNLSQVVLLKERDAKGKGNDEVLKGGLVEVKIVNRKTRKASQLAQWLSFLTEPISKNFEVESYHTVSRGRECSVTFYGIYTNCQLAGYAYRVAADRISQMAAEHKPTKHAWRVISTKSSRLCYALGIVRGIDSEVEANIKREMERRVQKLERAREAVSKGEAYEESDDDSGDGNDGTGFSFPSHPVDSNQTDPLVSSLSNNNIPDGDRQASDEVDENDKKSPATKFSGNSGSLGRNKAAFTPTTPPPPPAAVASLLTGEALNHRLKEMEDEVQNSLVLL